jgi:hypothetical protein
LYRKICAWKEKLVENIEISLTAIKEQNSPSTGIDNGWRTEYK